MAKPSSARGTSRAVALVLGCAVCAPLAWGKGAAAPAPPPGESLNERRAVRGVPVDELGPSESGELREIRQFEEAAFPRAGAPRPGSADGALPPASLPGSWGGSGDVPAELRTPPPRADADATPPPDSEWLRRLKLPDLPVRWDAQVLRYLDYFKNDPKGHAVMASWLRRAGRCIDYSTMYVLENSQGIPILYATAQTGYSLETYMNRNVELIGVRQFRSDLRAYHMTVMQVHPLH